MPDLEDVSLDADCIILEQAEFNNIRTLSYVLAQTVALHFYETYASFCASSQDQSGTRPLSLILS